MTIRFGCREVGWEDQWKPLILACFVLFIMAVMAFQANGEQIDGFTEPFRAIHVASPESGIIKQIAVQEGDAVQANQVLAELDNDVHLALLAIAKQSMEAKGRRDAALADFQLRQARLEKFVQLRGSGHARQEEVDRALTELAVAEGQLTAAEEDLLIKRLEYEKIKTQLERRSVRSPVAGVVSEIHKEEGEFVAPNTPEVVTIVELDPLLGTFSLMSPLAMQLHAGDEIKVRFTDNGKEVTGTIHFIAPITDAESGTVRVKVRIENPQGQFRSGERCVIELPKQKRSEALGG